MCWQVDWLRELVNAFCTQADREMRRKVLQRLRQLIWMERSLDKCLGLTPSFRLPSALLDAAAEAKQAERHAKAAAKAAEKVGKAKAAKAKAAAAKAQTEAKRRPAAKAPAAAARARRDSYGSGAYDA